MQHAAVSEPRDVAIAGDLQLEVRVIWHLLSRRLSREDWKAMPFDAMPPYVEFVLVFDPFGLDARWVESWHGIERQLHGCLVVDDIIRDQFTYRKSVDGLARAKLASRMRRRWCALVDHAIGYRLTGDWRHIFEFAE